MERTTAAMVALMVMRGAWQVSATTSSRRLLPHRFKGETTARRGACSQAGWAWRGRGPEGDGVGGLGAGEDHVAGERGVQLGQQPGAVDRLGGGDGRDRDCGHRVASRRARAAARRSPPCSSTA